MRRACCSACVLVSGFLGPYIGVCPEVHVTLEPEASEEMSAGRPEKPSRRHEPDGAAKRLRALDFDVLCRMHGYIMVFYGLAVFTSCLVEQTRSLRWLTEWGLRLSLLYSEADGTNPAVNAVYRVLAICMFGIGLYEIRLPELDERSKEYYSKAFVMYLLPVGLCFGYDAIQPYAGPLAWVTASVPLGFGLAGLYALLNRR